MQTGRPRFAGAVGWLLAACATAAQPEAPARSERRASGGTQVESPDIAGADVSGSEAPDDRWQTLEVGGGRLRIRLDAEAFDHGTTPIVAWIRNAAKAVTDYYGILPSPDVDLYVASFDGSGVGNGRVIVRNGRPTVLIAVGSSTPSWKLDRDWVLTHELVHLGFPSVPRQHHWIEEGLATYIEPIARARAGQRTEGDVWHEWLSSMHQGLPEEGDQGLDNTPTWGRTYWGGALFCLLADIEIRKQSNNRYGLRNALRAIVDHGGRIDQDWSLRRALAIGDEAVGVRVLEPLYDKMKDVPAPVDLDALWRDLGVRRVGEGVAYADDAPLADIRRQFILGE